MRPRARRLGGTGLRPPGRCCVQLRNPGEPLLSPAHLAMQTAGGRSPARPARRGAGAGARSLHLGTRSRSPPAAEPDARGAGWAGPGAQSQGSQPLRDSRRKGPAAPSLSYTLLSSLCWLLVRDRNALQDQSTVNCDLPWIRNKIHLPRRPHKGLPESGQTRFLLNFLPCPHALHSCLLNLFLECDLTNLGPQTLAPPHQLHPQPRPRATKVGHVDVLAKR